MSRTIYAASEGQKFAADRQFVMVTCPTCHIAQGIPASLYRSAQAHPGPDGWSICCPMGHSWHYTGQSEEEKAKAEADRLRAMLADERDWSASVAAQRDQAKADARAQKARGTRFKNERDRERQRAKAGVCPCCNRTFQNLARHMAGQHPDAFEAQA